MVVAVVDKIAFISGRAGAARMGRARNNGDGKRRQQQEQPCVREQADHGPHAPSAVPVP